jgi:hypothetical protein
MMGLRERGEFIIMSDKILEDSLSSFFLDEGVIKILNQNGNNNDEFINFVLSNIEAIRECLLKYCSSNTRDDNSYYIKQPTKTAVVLGKMLLTELFNSSFKLDYQGVISPIFKVYLEDKWYLLRGKVGVMGITDTSFIRGKANKYLWFFWGEANQFEGSIKILGNELESDDEVILFIANEIYGPHEGANAHLPTMIKIPSSGPWNLSVFINNIFFESIVVNVVE